MINDRMKLFDAISALKLKALEAGASKVAFSTSIGELDEAISAVGKGCLGEHFNRSLHTLPPNLVCWIGAFDDCNRPIAVVGARRDVVQGWTLQRHIKEIWERTCDSEDGSPVELAYGSCDFAANTQGDFAYIGEGWVNKDWRGGNLLATIQKALILNIFDEWRPALVYGWMRPKLVLAGKSIQWGYCITHRQGITWRKPPAQADYSELYFVACDQQGIQSLIRDPVS